MVDGRMHACGPASRPTRHPLATEPEESSADEGDVECLVVWVAKRGNRNRTSSLLFLGAETNTLGENVSALRARRPPVPGPRSPREPEDRPSASPMVESPVFLDGEVPLEWERAETSAAFHRHAPALVQTCRRVPSGAMR